jgi:hypothetical protein
MPLALTIELSDAQLAELAELVAQRLSANASPVHAGLVDAQTVADALGVSRDTVYEHAAEMGGRRIGDGQRPRWRFNLPDALAAWQPSTTEPPTRAAPRRRRSSNGHTNLLPVVE